MIIPGKDLIILADGVPLAASRSCNIDVDAEIIKVSNPTDGSWRHIITGLKSWKVSTNHLLKSASGIDGFVEAVAYAHNGVSTPAASYVRTRQGTSYVPSRGLTVFIMDSMPPYIESYFLDFDTYGDNQQSAEQEMERMADFLLGLTEESGPLAVVSSDAFGMNGTLRSAIETMLHVDLSMVENGRSRGALAAIGGYNMEKGVVGYVPAVGNVGGTTYSRLYLRQDNPVTDTPMKSMLAQVGTTVQMQIKVEGFVNDILQGSAICRSCRITGTNGNLAQGAFSWEGTGPLV